MLDGPATRNPTTWNPSADRLLRQYAGGPDQRDAVSTEPGALPNSVQNQQSRSESIQAYEGLRLGSR